MMYDGNYRIPQPQSPGKKLPSIVQHVPLLGLKRWQLWLLVALNAAFLLGGQSGAVLLGRLYFDQGGKSKWMSTMIQTAAFPVLFLPLLFFSPFTTDQKVDTGAANSTQSESPAAPQTTQVDEHVLQIKEVAEEGEQTKQSGHGHIKIGQQPIISSKHSIAILGCVYLSLGVLLAGDNFLYTIGLLILPLSTYSLLCATQLAFNALFSFFLIPHQKITALVLNSVVLLTLSASLIAIHSDDAKTVSKFNHYALGIVSTLAASAGYALLLSLMQFSFEKVSKRETFSVVLDMQIYTSLVATLVCVLGLFASGEWRVLKGEMEDFGKGKVGYVLTLVGASLAWQVCSVGVVGLVFLVSSLFSNVISMFSLPLVPVAAVLFYNEEIDGVKVVAMLLAIWGFASYLYQNYLDGKSVSKDDGDSSSRH